MKEVQDAVGCKFHYVPLQVVLVELLKLGLALVVLTEIALFKCDSRVNLIDRNRKLALDTLNLLTWTIANIVSHCTTLVPLSSWASNNKRIGSKINLQWDPDAHSWTGRRYRHSSGLYATSPSKGPRSFEEHEQGEQSQGQVPRWL